MATETHFSQPETSAVSTAAQAPTRLVEAPEPIARATLQPVGQASTGIGAVLDPARRLRAFLIVAGISFVTGAGIALLATVAGRRSDHTLLYLGLCVVMALSCASVWWLLATRAWTAAQQILAGAVLVVIGSSAMAVVEVMIAPPPGEARRLGISGIGVWIVLFPLIVPCSVRLAAGTAAAAASSLPAAYLVTTLAGWPSRSPSALADWFLPVYACAGLAVFSAWSISRLTRALANAQRELREVGRYELVDRLGRGGMGEVWSARHRLLPRRVAIKFIRQGAGGETDLDQRFDREARATARLVSPHTVRLYDYGVADTGERYYVMELLDGLALGDLVEDFGPLPVRRAVGLLIQACRSLEEAHAKGLIHRDIKPGNMMVVPVPGSGDLLKVLDFGLVSGVTATADAPIIEDGSRIFGTVGYIAPEYIQAADDFDQRADLYALGSVAWIMLTGQLPYRGSDLQDELHRHVHDPIPRIPDPDGVIPDGVQAAIATCLAKHPGQRWPDARSLREALEAAMPSAGWTAAEAEQWWAGVRATDPTSERHPIATAS